MAKNISLLAACAILALVTGCCRKKQQGRVCFPENISISRITSGPKHHFASAYYHLRTWDSSGRFLLCLETDIENHNPEADEPATLGMVDLETGGFIPLARTHAWNFQQGAMQQWLGSAPDSLVIYNDFRNGKFVSVILNAHTRKEIKVIERAMNAVSHDGKKGVSLNFARLHITRLGYGYAGAGDDPGMGQKYPEDDGLYYVDLESGESCLIVSLADIFRLNPPSAEETAQLLWMNHTLFNTDNTRVFFLGRSPRIDRGWVTAAYTVNPDGSDLRCVLPYDWSGSHFDWFSQDRLMVTTYYQGKRPICHLLFTDTEGEKNYRILGEGVLVNDGHGAFSPDRRWMVTDTYPDGRDMRTLMLLNMENDAVMPLGRFYAPPDNFQGPCRCDLHPGWYRDSNRICFDSVHEGTRQVYLAELDFGR
ncbi:MAG TPA: hypothetical protein VM123_10260 [archaeon]|nr:hypothetical protein [archaeon]